MSTQRPSAPTEKCAAAGHSGREVHTSRRGRLAVAVAAAVVLLAAGCGTSADPQSWEQAEQDGRFVDQEFGAKSAVEHNFMIACLDANHESSDGGLDYEKAEVLCRCSFDGLREGLTWLKFQALDSALRETPDPSDLDEEPEDSWDDIAEDIVDACDRRVGT